MKTNESYLIFNAIAFVSLLYYYYKHTRSLTPTFIILVIWALSSIAGFMYVYDCDYWIGNGKVSIEAVLTLLVLFLIYVYPLLKLKKLNNNNYKYCDNQIVLLSCYLVAVLAVIPFIENLLVLFNGKTINEMGSYHDEQTNLKAAEKMSFVGSKCMIIISWFKFVTPALLLNYLNVQNKNKSSLVVIGLIMAYFNASISSLCNGERFVVVQDGTLLFFLYLLFYETINKNIRKKFTIIGMIVLALFISGLAIISLYRFGDNDNETLMQSFYRYYGEGFNNFYTDMWYVENHTYGSNIFRGMVGMSAASLTAYTGIRMHCYYTFIGDFFCDFGLFGTFAIFGAISFSVYRMLLMKFTFISTLIFVLYVSILAVGPMYTVFMNYSESLIFFVAYLTILLFTEIKK